MAEAASKLTPKVNINSMHLVINVVQHLMQTDPTRFRTMLDTHFPNSSNDFLGVVLYYGGGPHALDSWKTSD
jgi:hypothetical protein